MMFYYIVAGRYITESPNVANNAYDPEGLFGTGDIGMIQHGNLYVYGRSTQDGKRQPST